MNLDRSGPHSYGTRAALRKKRNTDTRKNPDTDDDIDLLLKDSDSAGKRSPHNFTSQSPITNELAPGTEMNPSGGTFMRHIGGFSGVQQINPKWMNDAGQAQNGQPLNSANHSQDSSNAPRNHFDFRPPPLPPTQFQSTNSVNHSQDPPNAPRNPPNFRPPPLTPTQFQPTNSVNHSQNSSNAPRNSLDFRPPPLTPTQFQPTNSVNHSQDPSNAPRNIFDFKPPSLTPTQSPPPNSQNSSTKSSSSILSLPAPHLPDSSQPPPSKPELPKKRKLGGDVLTTSPAVKPSNTLQVAQAEVQTQTAPKKVKHLSDVVQQGPRLTPIPSTSLSPRMDVKRSESSPLNTLEGNESYDTTTTSPPYQRHSTTPLLHLEEPVIQNLPAFNREKLGEHDFLTYRNNHPVHFYADKNILVQLSGMRFFLPAILINGSRFFERLLNVSESKRFNSQTLDDKRLVSKVETELVNEHTLYVLDNLPVSLDDFVALLDFIKNQSRYFHKELPFDILAPVLRAGTTLEFTSQSAIAARSFYLMWNPLWDAKNWDLDMDVMSLDIPFTSLSPNALTNLVESANLAHLIGAKPILKRIIYEFASSSESQSQNMEWLSPHIKALINGMRGKLQLAWNNIAAVPSDIQCSSAEGSVVCIAIGFTNLNARNVAYRDIVHNSWMFQKYWHDPMGGIQALVESAGSWREKGYCEGCVRMKVSQWKEAKKNLWVELGECV